MTVIDRDADRADRRPDRSRRCGPTSPTVPHSPVRAAIAKRIFHRAAGADAAARRRAGRTQLRRRQAGRDPVMHLRPSRRRSSPGSARPARSASARPTWPATGPPTTWPACSSAFAANMRDLVPAVLHRLRHAVLQPHAAVARQHDRRRAREHPPPLRPVERAVQDVPRRVDDLLVGGLRRRAVRLATRTSPTRSAARSTGCSTPRRSAPARRLLEIGTGWGELAMRAAAPRRRRHDA